MSIVASFRFDLCCSCMYQVITEASVFFLMIRLTPRSTLFPYTTLFRSLEASTMKSRRGFAIQRLMNAMRQAHADGWFIVFDTLTLADDRLEAFYDNPNALRDYFRDIGRMVLAAEGRKA